MDVNTIAEHLTYEGWIVTDSTVHPTSGKVFSQTAKVDLRTGSPDPGSCQYNVVVWPTSLNEEVAIGRFQIHKQVKK